MSAFNSPLTTVTVAPNYDNAGRISRAAVIGSTSALFGIVVISLLSRLYIRIRVQKVFQIDDACIVAGVILLSVAIGALNHYASEMFIVEALQTGGGVPITGSTILQAFDFRKWVAASLILTWTIITLVKLSFMFLFWRLIDRIRALRIYWWFVMAFTIATYLFGICSYVVPCPDFNSLTQLVTCTSGAQFLLTVRFAVSQNVLDVFGDILILILPIKLIWQIQVQLSQKLALLCSLCLSVVLIAVTITRVSGLVNNSSVDVVWEVYWQFISAEVGLILSSATAFRALFVARNSPNGADLRAAHHKMGWATATFRRLSTAFTSLRWTKASKRSNLPKATGASSEMQGRPSEAVESLEMPQIPRPLMTGIRSFIGRQGRDSKRQTQMSRSGIMVSRTIEVSYDEEWPLAQPNAAYDGAPGYRSEAHMV